jgi:hypothetical protein
VIKPIVYYDDSADSYIAVGHRAMVYPLNHESKLVSNTKAVITSFVIDYDEKTGEFETLNSKYRPIGRERLY